MKHLPPTMQHTDECLKKDSNIHIRRSQIELKTKLLISDTYFFLRIQEVKQLHNWEEVSQCILLDAARDELEQHPHQVVSPLNETTACQLSKTLSNRQILHAEEKSLQRFLKEVEKQTKTVSADNCIAGLRQKHTLFSESREIGMLVVTHELTLRGLQQLMVRFKII